jgi:hypothetical protein
VARFSGSLQVTGLDSGHGPSLVVFPPSPVRGLCKNARSAGDGSTGGALLPDPGFFEQRFYRRVFGARNGRIIYL